MRHARLLVPVLALVAGGAPAVDIAVADDPQAVVNAHPAGTTYVVAAGLHRFFTVTPKDGDAFVGAPGAVVSGARLLTTFRRDGATWVADGQTQHGQQHGEVDPGWRSFCAEDLFIDDRALHHVVSRDLVAPGSWFFDYDAHQIVIGDDPTGRRVETSVTRAAFEPGAASVTIRSLVVEKYAIPAQMGAIGDQYPSPGWTIEDCEVRWNHGTGVAVSDHGVVRRCAIHHNGQKGVGAGGAGVLIEGNEIAWNNVAHFSAGWEAGGSKFSFTDGLVVRDNWSHDNAGPGLWTDIDNIRTTYEYNTCADNRDAGIFHEISYAATVRFNSCLRSGQRDWVYGSGIQISASRDVEAYGNLLEVTDGHGIELIGQNRGSGAYGPWLLRNDRIHDNDITYRGSDGMSGCGVDFADPDAQSGAGGNLFDHDAYHGPSLGQQHWGWNNAARDWAGFRAQGQEPNGAADTAVAPLGAGIARLEIWRGVAGDDVDALRADARFPAEPDARRFLTRFEYAGLGDAYGARARGLLIAPASGDYVFHVAGDDHCELWLGTDAHARTRRLIARVPGWTDPRQWDKYPEQRSATIHLDAGQAYYVEALQKQGSGGEHLAVGWDLPDGRHELPILGGRLSPYVVATDAPPTAAFARALAGAALHVDASSSGDADGAIEAYRWDFGDGARGIGAAADHPYAAPGTYTVTLTVVDDLGATATARAVVVVADGGTTTGGTTTGGASTAGTSTGSVTGGSGGSRGHGCGHGAAVAAAGLALALLLRRR